MSEKNLPTQFQLALLAAQLVAGTKDDPVRAVTEAVRIWEACGAELEAWPQRLARQKADLEAGNAQALEKMELKKAIASNPNIFPASQSHYEVLIKLLDFYSSGTASGNSVTFKTAMAWLMPDNSPSQRETKFRHALMAADHIDTVKAGEQMAQLKERQWFTAQKKHLQEFFDTHWKNYLKVQRSKSGRKRTRKARPPREKFKNAVLWAIGEKTSDAT
jgi:hypothetical protein